MICISADTSFTSAFDVAAVVDAACNDVVATVVAAAAPPALVVVAKDDVAASNASATTVFNLCLYVAAGVLSFCLEILLLYRQAYVLMMH